jgi:hypothetical protein
MATAAAGLLALIALPSYTGTLEKPDWLNGELSANRWRSRFGLVSPAGFV